MKTNGERARYTTLSHRWGTEEPFALTQECMEQMTRDIPWASIPRTFQDAVKITRELGVDYVWIDSLCIIQDDREDWRRESVQMAAVYGKSYLNIAATDSDDSHYGIFSSSMLVRDFPPFAVPEHPGIFIRKQPFQTHNDFGSNYGVSKLSPILLKRAWVLQERLLAPRVVYYGFEELKWECYSATDCQCGGMVTVFNFKHDHHASVILGETSLSFQWMRVAEQYSRMQLTYDSDRGVALSGIAAKAEKTGKGGRYLAGLWEKDLAHQICWEVDNSPRKPEGYLAPSWSWLSVFGTVWYPNRMDFNAECSTIDVEIAEIGETTVAAAEEASPTPKLFLRVNGRAAKMRAQLIDPGSKHSPPDWRLIHEQSGIEVSDIFSSDYAMNEGQAKDIHKMLILYWGNIWPEQHTFLMLKEVPGESQMFERFGLFAYSEESEKEELHQWLGWCQPEEDIVIF